MNTDTGEILPYEEIPAELAHKFVPINRSLSMKEKMKMQIALYSPCGCGSGKKFKFCCKTNK